MSLAFTHPGVSRRETRRAARRAAPATTSSTVEATTTAVTGVLHVRFVRLRSVAAFTFVLLLGFAGLGVAAAVGAWHLAVRRGIVEDAETLMLELGFETFDIRADQLLDVLLVAAAAGVLAGTILAVVGATLFNLVSWVTGGIEVKTRERLLPVTSRSGASDTNRSANSTSPRHVAHASSTTAGSATAPSKSPSGSSSVA